MSSTKNKLAKNERNFSQKHHPLDITFQFQKNCANLRLQNHFSCTIQFTSMNIHSVIFILFFSKFGNGSGEKVEPEGFVERSIPADKRTRDEQNEEDNRKNQRNTRMLRS